MSTDVIELAGELTIHTAAENYELMRLAIAEGACELDMSRVSELDTAGMQLVVSMSRTIHDSGREFRVRATSDAVRALQRLYALGDSFMPSEAGNE